MKLAHPLKNFTPEEHKTWKLLFDRQTPLRSEQLIPEFSEGLAILGITHENIPDLNQVNDRLYPLTGWQGVPVNGFEGPETFYHMLAERKFPIGNFIRDIKDLSYTPEPDIFHDLYGHIPFFTIPAYADFCCEFGLRSSRYLFSEKITREFQRFFWFSIEFGLIKTKKGRRIFGSGIASSFGECEYALSTKPQVVPFNLEKMREQEFRIDVIQNILFELDSAEQLYQCLDAFEKPYLHELKSKII